MFYFLKNGAADGCFIFTRLLSIDAPMDLQFRGAEVRIFLIKFICFDEKKSLLVDACLFLLEWPLDFFQIAKNADSFRLLDLATRD